MARLGALRKACVVFLLCNSTAIAGHAQTFTNLLNFDGGDGAKPYLASLVQGVDGNFYGTTEVGGNKHDCPGTGCGTVFRITPTGALTTVPLSSDDGSIPYPGLLLSTEGKFYGVTKSGGDNGDGTVFTVSRNGRVTMLYSFCTKTNCADGASPFGTLIEAADGSFYGTTISGGTGTGGRGTVFKITAPGTLTTLYSFCSESNCADGTEPYAGLVQASDGNFYGTTSAGGNGDCEGGCGTVFRMTPAGVLTTTHSFDASEGSDVVSALILGADGNFYGTTYLGGTLSCDPPYGCGTVFKVTPSGALTTLHSFDGTDGLGLKGTLLSATDGNLYGTTSGIDARGEVIDYGTIFGITPTGLLSTLHSFNDTDGGNPTGGLLQATSGKLYGTTVNGGNFVCNKRYGCGTVFSLDMGLSPFVAFVHGYGRVGRTFGILGQGFTGTSSVMLNGTPTTFKVKSDTLIGAAVPSGATTGYITVVTPSGTLTSNVPFHVLH